MSFVWFSSFHAVEQPALFLQGLAQRVPELLVGPGVLPIRQAQSLAEFERENLLRHQVQAERPVGSIRSRTATNQEEISMSGFQQGWVLVAAIVIAAPGASAQGQGNGNGNGGGGGGGGGAQEGVYAPVLVVNGQRTELEENLSVTLGGDYGITSRFNQPQQIVPSDGGDREPLYAVSTRGDISPRQADDLRYILDVRISDTSAPALISVAETEGTFENATWWYVPAEDDGVDVVLVPDLTGWTIVYAKWSRDLEWIAVDGTSPGGAQGIFLWDVTLSAGVPVSATLDATPFVADAVDPTWGAGYRLSFVKDDNGNGLGEIYVKDLVSGALYAITTQVAIPGSSAVQAFPFFRDKCALSPDGTQIAYTKFTDVDRTDIFVAAADGSGGELQVTSPQRVKANGYYLMSRFYAPVWAPDGLQLAFALSRWNSFPFPDTWRITIAGNSKAKKLTDDFTYSPSAGENVITGECAPIAWRD